MKRQIPDDVLYDKRLIERHMKAGFFTLDELEKRKAAAPDTSEQASHLDIDAVPGSKNTPPRR